MKRFLLILAFVFISCCSRTAVNDVLTDEFYSDFSSENNRIAGELYLDVYNENLASLTYEYYINYLSQHEAPSAKGLVNQIKSSASHYLKTAKSGFLIALLFQKSRTIVCDNSKTAFLDTVHTYQQNETIPPLSEFVEKLKFK